VVALVAFVAVAAFGALTYRDRPPAVPKDAAIARALAVPRVRALVHPGDRAQVLHVDDRLDKVVWYRDGRAVASAGVTAQDVLDPEPIGAGAGWGAASSHAAIVLAAATLLFLLAILRVPLRADLRALDAVMTAALLAPAVLIDHGRYAVAEGLVALLLLYLVGRGATIAVRGSGAGGGDDDAPVLLEALAARLRASRLPAQLAWALLAATVIVTATSTGIVDIGVADMEGATVLLHGHLPYGHMPTGDVVHGDTYGLPIYVFSAPFAVLWPVRDSWDDAIGALVGSIVLLAACLAGLTAATRSPRRAPGAIAFLAFPAALMAISSGTNDLMIAALLVWAFAWWARPAASAALLALAGAAKLAPLVLLPLWLARLRGRDLAAATAACVAVGLGVLTGLLALGGLHGPTSMVHAIAFQFSRHSELSVWDQFGLGALQPLAQALTMAVALGGAALVRLDPAVARDPRRVAGLVGAALAGLQLSAGHWAPMYLLWLAPPVMIALFSPLGVRAAVPAVTPVTASADPRLAPA
jgi:Glycosyltransferase family 87